MSDIDPDPVDELRFAVNEANRRRTRSIVIVAILTAVAALNLATSVGVGLLFLQQRTTARTQVQAQKTSDAVRDQRAADLYTSSNDTNRLVHQLAGVPAPVVIVPPSTTIVPNRSPAAPTAAPAARPATPSTTVSPPSTATPAAPQPSPTTTTQPPAPPCTTAVLGRCVIP